MVESSQRGRNNRRKGAAGERELCGLLADYLGAEVKRTLGQERDGGTDVHWSGYAFEVKRRKAIAGLYEWLAQADKGKGVPVAACRADGKEMLIVMRFQDWATLVRESLNA